MKRAFRLFCEACGREFVPWARSVNMQFRLCFEQPCPFCAKGTSFRIEWPEKSS